MEIGLFFAAWSAGVPIAVVGGGILTDRLGPAGCSSRRCP